MTDFTLPPFVVDYDGRWISVDLQGDLGEWARRTAREVVARWGVRGGKREIRLAVLLEAAGAIARKAQDASMAYLLYPVLGESIRAIVRFCPVDLAGREGEQAWSELLGMLLEPVPGVSSPEVTEISTRAGQCRRIRWQWLLNEGTEGPVGEHLAYVWAFPQYGSGVMMATSFTNLEEAGKWRPALDELAAAAGLEESLVTENSATTANGAVIEIRPVPPQGRVLPGDNAALRKWVLRANPADGTLVLTEDRPFIITPVRRLNLALPSSGRPDAVHTVCLVDNRWYKNMQTGVAWRPLFLNQEGRVLARGRTRDEPKASQMWPLNLFTPLRALGVAVTQETYPSPKALRHAHPKA